MRITIASGKGGTGKTTISTNLANVLSRNIEKRINLYDCDVEEPNVSEFIKSTDITQSEVMIDKPVWNQGFCNLCGKCKDICSYNAIAEVSNRIIIFNELCHSCGACKFICPHGGIEEKSFKVGDISSYKIKENFNFHEGRLKIGETRAPQIISQLKSTIDDNAINILDSSPGAGCVAVEAFKNSNYVVLVAEPTLYGLHDLKEVVELADGMNIPFGIVINRAMNDSNSLITEYAAENGIPIIGAIPNKIDYAKIYSKGELISEHSQEYSEIIESLYSSILENMNTRPKIIVRDSKVKPFDAIPKDDSSQIDSKAIEITVLSGKGGTGKTTLTASLKKLNPEILFADGDVDAANLNIGFDYAVAKSEPYHGARMAQLEIDKCINCGKCVSLCRFGGAVQNDGITSISLMSCEGCGLCEAACPVNAITIKEITNGCLITSEKDNDVIIHAALIPGAENSGKLVSRVREEARDTANKLNRDKIIVDGPPGISCPAIASATGAKSVVVVTEPTVSGLHDLKRVLKLVKQFEITPLIVVNKIGLNSDIEHRIEILSTNSSSPIVGRIPYDERFMRSCAKGEFLVDSDVKIKSIFSKISNEILNWRNL